MSLLIEKTISLGDFVNFFWEDQSDNIERKDEDEELLSCEVTVSLNRNTTLSEGFNYTCLEKCKIFG